LGHFVPHTDADIERMLSDLGLGSLDELFSSVPAALRLAGNLDMASGISEPDVLEEMARLAAANRGGRDLVCFAGAGAYDHELPSVTKSLTFRSEFVTAYTPYQPEVAQGVLQALFEYQTLVARLAGLEVANASLYDGAAAAVEAVNLAVASKRRQTVWVRGGIHPHWREVLDTFAAGTGHELVDVPLVDGSTDWASAPAGNQPSAVLVSSPNYLGVIEDLTQARSAAGSAGALLLVGFDPVSSGLLRPPGEFGLFASRLEHVRRLPGRLVGRTVDTQGTPAYVTTLRAREQDIRREKASSNVCTNQTLIAVACMIQLCWLGTSGLREMALRSARGARFAREALLAVPGVSMATEGPTLREFALRSPVPADTVIDRMADEGYLAGVAVDVEGGVVSDGGELLLVAVTERRTRAEIEGYVSCFEKVVR
jgi:glycine dehydrogenase subunit 1